MGIFDPLLSKPPVDNVSNQKLLLVCMMNAETHPADDADGNRILVLSLLGANVTFHVPTSDGLKKEGSTFKQSTTCVLEIATGFLGQEERRNQKKKLKKPFTKKGFFRFFRNLSVTRT
jgi:hypothetical protein